MEHRKLFRMSTPVVIVGFIIMVPSVLGMALAAAFLLTDSDIVQWFSAIFRWVIRFRIALATGDEEARLQCSICRAVVNAS